MPRKRNPARIPLIITGSILTGLGAATMAAAGITWLTAWGRSGSLDDDICPGGYCVIGTRGGDKYQSVEDSAIASEVLIAAATPVMFSGLSMLIIGASLRNKHKGPRFSASLSPTSAKLEVRF